MRVALVGCSGTKLDRPAPARELYAGNLFKLSVRWVERRPFDAWAILSAKHGLVLPDEVIEPYDVMLDGRRLKAWAALVEKQLVLRWGEGAIYTLLAGDQYGVAVQGLPFVEDVFRGWARQRKLDGHRRTGIGVLMRELKLDRAV